MKYKQDCPFCSQSIKILEHDRYGGWSYQDPAHGTLGRFDPRMTRILPDTRTVEIGLRFDRAAYEILTKNGMAHREAVHYSLITGSFSQVHNAPGRGVWEFEIVSDDDDLIEFVAMLWPKDDKWWPNGEINIVEGRVNKKETMTNLHWEDEFGLAQHDPLMVPVDVTKRHIYKVVVDDGFVDFYIDNRLVRHLESEHVHPNMERHMVIQAGVNEEFLHRWHPDIEWEAKVLFRPIRTPELQI